MKTIEVTKGLTKGLFNVNENLCTSKVQIFSKLKAIKNVN